MSIAAGALAMGRSLAAQLMDDTVRVYRSGERVWDEEIGDYTTAEVVLYEGKARVRMPRAFSDRVDEQGASISVQPATVSLPVEGTGAIQKDDHIAVTASRFDPDMVGLVLRVVDGHWQAHSTARRIPVEIES